MRWSRPGLLLWILAAGCPPTVATPVMDAGTDAGSCPPPCTPPPLPPLCPDLDGGTCSDTVLCCPGLLCSAGRCVTPPNPCPNGERPRASGCACDPTAGDGGGCICSGANQGGCDASYACFADLHCHEVPDAGDAGPPLPCAVVPCDPNGGEPLCAPSGNTCICTTTTGDTCSASGRICDQTFAKCRLPVLGEPCTPRPGCQAPVECDADPSGAHLYVCTATCSSNAECSNGWQYCTIPDGGTRGVCADNACDRPYAPCSLHLPGGSSGSQGLCLPYGVLQTNPDGTKQAVTFGLCLEASLLSGATGVPCDRLFRRAPDAGPDAGIDMDGGPGSFCNLVNVCTPSGTCAPACNLANGQPCLIAGPHCKKIDPRPFASARDPDSGVLEGSGACQ